MYRCGNSACSLGPSPWRERWPDQAELAITSVNGCPALLLQLNGEVDGVLTVRVEHGLITAVYTVRNPDKLSHIATETHLTR